MPYIKPEERTFHPDAIAECAGDLNYMFTLLIKGYMEEKGLSYQTINDIVGALEGAKLEFYRRVAVPYEQKKIEENSDVY
jgi:hypothetical protein